MPNKILSLSNELSLMIDSVARGTVDPRLPVPREPVQVQVAGSVTAIAVLGVLHCDYRTAV